MTVSLCVHPHPHPHRPDDGRQSATTPTARLSVLPDRMTGSLRTCPLSIPAHLISPGVTLTNVIALTPVAYLLHFRLGQETLTTDTNSNGRLLPA